MARALDIADLDAVRAFADAIHREHGSIDVVMNIAGISVWGTRAGRGGHLVNVSSAAGLFGQPSQSSS